ncbi:MAG TPA: NTP transferase domain-containing protein [Firmicutes bacterium]|nr:NTP transferase domain-containing protein [Bacillota bacterium]
MNVEQAAAVVLAAGQGSRMKSKRAKVLHKIAGLEMVRHVVRSVREAGINRIYVVIGHQGEEVRQVLGDVTCVEQAQQLGTGHAVAQCRSVLAGFDGPVLVTYGDTPLLTGATFRELIEYHRREEAGATVITAILDDPTGYGRIVRDKAGNVEAIVEHKDASPTQREIKEINTGTYCFNSKLLFEYLTQITPDNAQAEYYLPDVLPLMISAGHKVAGYVLPDPNESLGINDRVQLSQAESIMQERICRSLMLSGVTIIDPQNTYIELGCRVGQDTVIYPQTVIQGGTVIGEDCTIGPNCRLANSQIGSGVVVEHSVVVDSVIGDGVRIDPHSYLNNCKKVEG